MTLDEAILHAEEVVEGHEKFKQIKAVTYEECKCAEEHRQLAGWMRELKEFKEKAEPRMVRYEGDEYADGEMVYDYAFCPNCDHETEVDSENWGSLFCPECGQRLRWEK